MRERRTDPGNKHELLNPRRPRLDEEQPLPPSASTSPADESEDEETAPREVKEPSTKEEHGASDALMESYNG